MCNILYIYIYIYVYIYICHKQSDVTSYSTWALWFNQLTVKVFGLNTQQCDMSMYATVWRGRSRSKTVCKVLLLDFLDLFRLGHPRQNQRRCLNILFPTPCSARQLQTLAGPHRTDHIVKARSWQQMTSTTRLTAVNSPWVHSSH